MWEWSSDQIGEAPGQRHHLFHQGGITSQGQFDMLPSHKLGTGLYFPRSLLEWGWPVCSGNLPPYPGRRCTDLKCPVPHLKLHAPFQVKYVLQVQQCYCPSDQKRSEIIDHVNHSTCTGGILSIIESDQIWPRWSVTFVLLTFCTSSSNIVILLKKWKLCVFFFIYLKF